MQIVANLRLGLLFCFVMLWVLARAKSPVSPTDPLREGFVHPPSGAKPRVWWHWMNGNITKEGIKLDLEWMHRVGIGGFQIFDADLDTPVWVDKPLVYMTPEWKDALLFATKLADQLGLEEGISGSPGFSESGGPWVKPSQGMKKVVWTETQIQGGKSFVGKLNQPPSVSGPFQNIPVFDYMATFWGEPPAPAATAFYRDIEVIAFRLPDSEIAANIRRPRITASSPINAEFLADGDLLKTASLKRAPPGENAWIQFEYASPQIVRAVTLALNDPVASDQAYFNVGAILADVEASDDGKAFQRVASIPADGAIEHTIAFPPTARRFFRVVFKTPLPEPALEAKFDSDAYTVPAPRTTWDIAELILHPGPRVNRFEDKAGFATALDLDAYPTPPVERGATIDPENMLDLTSRMRADGSLNWTPPRGRWVVLRFGFSLTGMMNHPAPRSATGLEVDKLNHEDVKSYMSAYLGAYERAVAPLMGQRGLQFVVNDSWEAGPANWTDDMFAEFTRRRGYDPRKWLVALTGRVIGSAEASDRFLWDYRKTLSDLVTENHYDQLNDLLHARGMGHYGESHEVFRTFIGDGMEAKRTDDIPMSAMWTQTPWVNSEQFGANADIQESASVAHIYGQNIVAAESLTATAGAFAWSPETLKPTADKEMSLGVNRFVIHTSVHQPFVDRKPGLSLGPYGQWFTRNETWAEQAAPWVSYLSRSSFLLQQGQFVADVLYFYGEDSNLTAIFRDHSPELPEGYGFDYINADALIHKVEVKDGVFMTPSGMRYRVLVLDPRCRLMSLAVLRRLRDLADAGGIIIGERPQATPSLADDEVEFRALADQLWGDSNTHRVIGKGQVYGESKVVQVLSKLQISPDFAYTGASIDTKLTYVHRKLDDGDLYYVDNRSDRTETVSLSFRVVGKQAELWHADTGHIDEASYEISNGRTMVPVTLEPWGAVFVVLRRSAAVSSRALTPQREEVLQSIEGPWIVRFQANRGAPAEIQLTKLTPWQENATAGIKFFSGTATYTKDLEIPKNWLGQNEHLWIDLGTVKNLAQVIVNGQPLEIVWKSPFRVDVTGAVEPGHNRLEIQVTNAWANRIIGDRQPNGGTTYTFTSPQFYKADSPLQPSGLLGPVRLVRVGDH